MSQPPVNQFLRASVRPDPYLGSHMSYEQIDRYGLMEGLEGHLRLIREKRDSLLKRTDWIVKSESNVSADEKILWEQYRQDLRDIPENFIILKRVTWPEPPLYERLLASQ